MYSVKTYLSRQENPYLEKTFEDEEKANSYFKKQRKKTHIKGYAVWANVFSENDNIIEISFSFVNPTTISREKQFIYSLEDVFESIEHNAFINLRYLSNRGLGFSLEEISTALIKLKLAMNEIIEREDLIGAIKENNASGEFYYFHKEKFTSTLNVKIRQKGE